jgi:hypothetical protein
MPTVTGDNFYIDKHTLQFRTGETGVASIVYDKTDESISIANAGTGQISIGDAGGDIYIGDGSTETDIIFEQNGAIRALTNKTLKLGQGDSDVKVEAQNFLVTGDAGFSGTVTINGNPVMTGANPYDEDTLQTVTDRGATTTNAITLQNNLTLSYNYPRINLTDTNNDSDYSIINNDGSFGIYDVTNTAYRLQILSGGNVGIGSTTPAYKLDVAGDIATDRYIRHNGDTNTYFGFPSDDTIQFNTNSSERMRITSAGNVGIGTNSPNQKFVVTARSNFDSQNNFYGSWVDGNTAGDSFFAVGQWWNVGGRMQAGSNNMYIHTHNSSHDLVLQSGGGYVGIGTNSPSQKLEIIADATALADQPAEPLFVHNDGNSIDGRVFLSVKHDEITTAQALGAGLKMTAGAVTAGTASYFDSLIFLEGAAAGSDTIHSAPKAIKFYVDNHGTAAGDGNDYSQLGDLRLTIAEDGNIGIGDASPIGDLQIGTNVFSGANGVYADDRIGLSVNGGLKSMVYASTYNNATYPDYGMVFIHGPNTGDYNVWSISPDGPAKGSGLNFIYRKDATNIHTTTPKVVFDGNGNVGIGTNDPNVPLEIAMNSTELVNLGSSGPNATIQFGSASSTTFGSIGARQTNTSQSALGFLAATPNSSTALYGDMFFSTRENDDSDFSTTAGKRAFSFVRYTNPLMEDLLTVSAGAGSSTTDLVNVGGTGNGRMLVRHIEGKDFNSASLDTLYLNYDSNGAIIAAYGGGNVGIGTNNPDAKLHLHKNSAGSVSAISQSTLVVENNSANAISMLTPNNTTSYLVFGDPDDNQRGYLSYTHADDTMRFKVGGDERMFITGNGNISIGTTALAPHKLNVKGTIVHLNDSNIQVVGITNANGDGRFYANNAGGVTKALIDSNGDSYINGDKFHVGVQSSSHAFVHINGRQLVESPTVPSTVTISDSGDSTKAIRIGYEPTWDVGCISASDLGAGWKDIVIAPHGANGNVGIGTTNPDRKVVIDAGAGYPLKLNSTQEYLLGLARNGTEQWWFKVNTAGDFTIHENFANDRFRIKAGGNVGIGVGDPDATLEVKGAGNTNATTSLHVRDSDDQKLFMVRNDGVVTVEHNYFYASASAGAYVENGLRVRGFLENDQGALAINGDVNFDSNTLYVDSSNNRIGLGTNSPSGILDVDGVAYFRGGTSVGHTANETDAAMVIKDDFFIHTQTSSNYLRRLIGKDSSHNIHVGESQTELIQSIKFYAGSSANAHYAFHGGATERMRIEGGGNVGIGSTNPQKLDVNGNIKASQVGVTNIVTNKIVKFGGTYLDDSIIYDDGTNVGIATNSPTSKLHVYGGDNTGLFGSIRNDFTNRMNIKVAMGSTTRYIGTVEQYGNGDSSGFTIRIYDGAEKVFRIVRVVVQNSGGTNSVSATVEGGGEDTDIHINLEYKNRDGDATKTDFFLVPTSKSFTQYVEIEGYILRDTGWNTTSLTSVSLDDDLALNILDSVNGSRVGVGTTDPSAKFHAEGSMIVKGDAGWAGTDNQDGAIFLNTAGRALLGAFSTSYARPLIRTSNNYIEHGSAGTSLINGFRFYAGSESSPIGTYDFYTSGSNSRLHIEKGGNIGIGTNSPSANLDIYNDSSWSELHLDGSNGGEIKLQKAGTTHLDIYASDVGSTASVIKAQSHLQLASNNSTAANSSIYLKSNGNVGIGTDSPSGTLHVSNTGSEYTDKFIVDGSHGRLFNVSDETTGIIFSVNDAAGLPVLEVDSTSGYDKVSIGEFGTNALVVSGSGVSIGVTGSREEVLEVYPDKDESAILGKAHVGYVGFSNFAGFSHVDRNSTTTYALLQSEAGSTYLNKAAGQQIYFRNGNSNVGGFNNYDDFYVGASSTDNIFYVDRSTDRVGIGTTLPSHTLTLSDATSPSLKIIDTTNDVTLLAYSQDSDAHVGTYSNHSLILDTNSSEAIRITSAGNVGIGVSSNPSSKLEVNGSFSASSKTFNIEHPTQSGKRLIHGCFEGPEHGVYFRGKTQDSGIQAPEYWSGLVDIDSMTVDVTPIGPNQSIYVDRIEDNGDVYVGANTEEPLNYFYVVYGERKDIDKLEVVKDAPVADTAIV